MTGKALKKMADEAGLGPMDVCQEAGISIPSLYKVYNDQPIRTKTRNKVVQAINALRLKLKASRTAG